jgi:hypothetical protein
MIKNKTTTDFAFHYKQTSARITKLLVTSGPLSLQEIQNIIQESYFAVSTSVGMMYQDKVIDIHSEGKVIIVYLA